MGDVWQARNLRKTKADGSPLSKNFTSGDVNECIFVYRSRNGSDGSDMAVRGNQLVLVEDPVSAIRVAALQDAMPLLGSHLSTGRLTRLAGLYTSLVVWLDSDKMKEARSIAKRAQLIGLDTRVIYTELDPKCYTNAELETLVLRSSRRIL